MSIRRDFFVGDRHENGETNENENKMDGQNPAANKNYMSSLAAEVCNRRFSHQLCIVRQENRSEFQPCI